MQRTPTLYQLTSSADTITGPGPSENSGARSAARSARRPMFATVSSLLVVLALLTLKPHDGHAGPGDVACWLAGFCSGTVNHSDHLVFVGKQWCGDDFTGGPCDESIRLLLDPGDQTDSSEDWDGLYFQPHCTYTGTLHRRIGSDGEFFTQGSPTGHWFHVSSNNRYEITEVTCDYDESPGGGSGSGTDHPPPDGSPGSTFPDEPDAPSESTPSLTAFQANTGFLYTRDDSGTTRNTWFGMMNGTSPATSNGQVAFQANTGFLYTLAVNGAAHDTRFGMMAGTSPALSGGQIAFQANTSLLYTRNMATGKTVNLQLGLMAGTSPSIAGNTSSWRIAFQANTGFLYYRDSGGATVNTGLGMMAGTSPSITKLSNGNYMIAFQANTGMLWVLNDNGNSTDLRLGLMAGTSPSISASGTAWTIAFQANTGFLFTRNSGGATFDTRYGMLAHTSPSIRGTRIVFQANTGFLYYRDTGSAPVNTEFGMMTGTNPSD